MTVTIVVVETKLTKYEEDSFLEENESRDEMSEILDSPSEEVTETREVVAEGLSDDIADKAIESVTVNITVA